MALSWHFLTLSLGLILVTLINHCYCQLTVGFYKGKCGENDIEKVIYEDIKKKIANDPDVVSDLVRLSFHDCIVRGCDASIMLEGDNTEQQAKLNKRLGGIKIANSVKKVVESTCPGVVSCADVIILATRAAIYLAGGTWYEVETGRRDSLVSLKSEAEATIPPPTIPFHKAIELFAKKGLNKEDFVVLLGSHTVGTAHCHSFKQRLSNYLNTNKPDPTISPSLFPLLLKTCPLNNSTDSETFLDQTPGSNFTIDNGYYKQILAHNGVLEIDQKLALNSTTRDLVKDLAYSSNNHFLEKFNAAMVKMSKIGVLTGDEGEIRKKCGALN